MERISPTPTDTAIPSPPRPCAKTDIDQPVAQPVDQIIDQVIDQILEKKILVCTPRAPVTWASGYTMPVYIDNRVLLRTHHTRSAALQLMLHRYTHINNSNTISLIAATATAGIPLGTLIAHTLKLDFVYVRPSPKSHGLGYRIEGLSPQEHKNPKPLAGQHALIIEDLISTGTSFASVGTEVRNAGATVSHCLAFFSYGFDDMALDQPRTTPPPPQHTTVRHAHNDISVSACITFRDVYKRGVACGYFSEEEQDELTRWMRAPFVWKPRKKQSSHT